MNISGLSLKELETLQGKIAREIEKRKQTGKADALKKAREAALKAGYTLEELVGGKAPRAAKPATAGAKRGPKPGASKAGKGARKPVAIKYRHPEQTELTWTGRGKTPRWVSAWKDANGSLDGITVQ